MATKTTAAGAFVISPSRHIFIEMRKTLVRLVAYFVLLAAIFYGSFALLSTGLVSAFATHDDDRDGMRPAIVAMPMPERIHPSLRPRLRGSIVD